MLITVAGKQVETGEALRIHVEEKLGTICRKYFDHALEVHVTFHRDQKARPGAAFCCDINLRAGRNLFMRAEGEGVDAHRAYDLAAEHLAKRLRRYRRRVNEHARSMAEERDLQVEAARRVVLEPQEEEAEASANNGAEAHGVIVAEDTTNILRLSVGEAVMRMDLEHRPVMMFRNSGSGALNVVDRREDGNIGWIDAR